MFIVCLFIFVQELQEQQYQEKQHLTQVHEKKVRGLQDEVEQVESDAQRKQKRHDDAMRYDRTLQTRSRILV